MSRQRTQLCLDRLMARVFMVLSMLMLYLLLMAIILLLVLWSLLIVLSLSSLPPLDLLSRGIHLFSNHWLQSDAVSGVRTCDVDPSKVAEMSDQNWKAQYSFTLCVQHDLHLQADHSGNIDRGTHQDGTSEHGSSVLHV